MTDVLRFEPDAEGDASRLAYTFGGFDPLVSVRPGTTVSTWTMDCFAGRVRTTADLVSEVCDPRYLNPQTGPFYVEGAEPGDTLALHLVSLQPARNWGASAHIPFFGGMTGTDRVVTLQDALPDLDQARVLAHGSISRATTSSSRPRTTSGVGAPQAGQRSSCTDAGACSAEQVGQ